MSKVIFLDVDGTLINYKTETPQSAKIAIDKARANGHHVYICTGCSKAEILQRDLPDLDGMIGANGGYVEDHDEVLLHQSLTYDQTKHVVDWCTERNMGFILECNSGRYVDPIFMEQGPDAFVRYKEGKGASDANADFERERIKTQFFYVEGDDRYRDDVNKISFVLHSYQDHLDSKEEFKDMIANTWGGKGELAIFGDLGPQGITKKKAIEVLLKHLGANVEDTISFGDAKIDLSMFELCNFNVAMGNGGPEIKEAADYITDDVDDDGLYNAFKYLKLF
ncbi:MAG: Cof-type HAD-IIB family hydrolase [Faecalicoccus sp.]|nr:Cof-type HAD-IIB family hydrolase [Faecalicoccus sp.]